MKTSNSHDTFTEIRLAARRHPEDNVTYLPNDVRKRREFRDKIDASWQIFCTGGPPKLYGGGNGHTLEGFTFPS